MPIYKTKNVNFFKNWSPEMAYVLGFFAADGNMLKNKRGAHFIEIQSTDKEILYEIRKTLNSNLKIGEYQPKPETYKRRYRLQIGSKIMFKDLLKLGMSPRKSKIIDLPKIPEKYFCHFVRGYFDGDGCVNVCIYKKYGRKKLSTVINSGFTSGSKKILKALRNKLTRLSITTGGTFYCKKDSYYQLWFSIKDSLRLYKFMYGNLNNDLFLERKKVKFEKYFGLD